MAEYPNWFKQTAQVNFYHYLQEFKDLPNLNFLQIGAFTGDASVWMLQNILTNSTSVLHDVDTWKGSDEQVHAEMDFEDVYNVYLAKTGYRNRVHFVGTSVNYLLTRATEWAITNYDFIYIDGDHTASAVLDDAVLAWQFLKSDGIMAFDDYTWGSPKGVMDTPAPAIDAFLAIKAGQYKMIAKNEQVWIRKK